MQSMREKSAADRMGRKRQACIDGKGRAATNLCSKID